LEPTNSQPASQPASQPGTMAVTLHLLGKLLMIEGL
jgi:hypothetical protein